MDNRIGRTLHRLRFPFAGFRAFLLPLLLLNLFLCVCLAAQTGNLALPHPIPPPAADDPPPAQRQTVSSKPATTQSARQKPASAASTAKTSAPGSSSAGYTSTAATKG